MRAPLPPGQSPRSPPLAGVSSLPCAASTPTPHPPPVCPLLLVVFTPTPHPPLVCSLFLVLYSHGVSAILLTVSSCLFFIPSVHWSSPPSSNSASLAQASVVSPLQCFGSSVPHPCLSSEPSEMCVPEKPALVTAFFCVHSAGLCFSVAPS